MTSHAKSGWIISPCLRKVGNMGVWDFGEFCDFESRVLGTVIQNFTRRYMPVFLIYKSHI